MPEDGELSLLLAKVAELQRRVDSIPTNRIEAAQAEAHEALNRVASLETWRNSLRGTQGVTVIGNIIQGPVTAIGGAGGGGGSGLQLVLVTVNVSGVRGTMYVDGTAPVT